MKLRPITKNDKVKKLALKLKGLPKEVINTIIFCDRVTALNYKWFEIPKVRVEAKYKNSFNLGLPIGQSSSYTLRTLYVFTLYYYINNKRLYGWSETNNSILRSCLEIDFANKLTRTLNTISPNTSRSKEKSKKLIEKFFKVKVREL